LSQAARLGHRLKGTIIYLGAERAEKAVTAVEQLGNDDDSIYAEEAVQTLEQACNSLEKALIEHCAQ
jgi:HPt (histidine-containing phosphotransfer) domain-containing protein